MINAEEARTRTEANRKSGNFQRQQAEAKIAEAIENGKYFCWLEFYASDDTKRWLEAHGFQVGCVYDVEGLRNGNTRVEW